MRLHTVSKVNNCNQGYEKTISSFKESLQKLQTEYLDAFLVHWPGQDKARMLDTWKAMEHLYKKGKVKSIGVCNFEISQLTYLLEHCEIKPMIDQVEHTPLMHDEKLISFCKENNIQIMSWGPLLRGNLENKKMEEIAEKYNIAVDAKKGRAYVGKGIIEGQKVLLVKPQTYMNLSGESIRELVDYFKVDSKEELLVIYDDISLNPGQIRIRKKGSAGGHNGIKNIIAQLGTDTFQRIKVGVGEKPKGYDLAAYVLGHFHGEDLELMEEGYEKAISATEEILKGEIDAAMNEYNRKVKPKGE